MSPILKWKIVFQINFLHLWLFTLISTISCSSSIAGQSIPSSPLERYVSVMMSFTTKDSPPAVACSTHSPQARSPTEGTVMSDNTALAIVLYQEENQFPHEKRNRSFQIGGHQFHIQQDWHHGGVAAVVWDAAVVLGEYLVSDVVTLQGRRVLELGAGTGLAGMVAATQGADVTVTERAEALQFLETAISKNQAARDWRIKAAVLDWTQEVDTNIWGHFDLVIGADIVYIEDTFPDLLKTLKAVASSPQTQVLLSCRIRYKRDLRFLHMLKKFFTVDEIFYNSDLDIKIFSAVFKS